MSGDGLFVHMDSARRALAGIVRRTFPLHQTVADNFHRGHCCVAQACVAGDLPADALAFIAKHVAYALEFKNDPVDFFHRRAGNPADQHIEIVGDRLGCRLRVGPLPAEEGDIAPDEFADLTLESARRRLVDIAEPVRRLPIRGKCLRAGFSGTALSVPSRSGLMAVMVNSYKSANDLRKRSPVAANCRMRLGRPWGGAGAASWNFPANDGRSPSYAPTFMKTGSPFRRAYQCSLKPAVMLLLLVAWPKSVTAVVTWSGP